MLRKWRDALDAHHERAFPGHGNPRDADLARLQRENARLKEENAIPKKRRRYHQRTPPLKYRIVFDNRGDHSVKALWPAS